MAKDNILTRARKKKAQDHLDQGQLPEAKLLLEQVCRTDRQDAEAWYGLGIVNGLIDQQ